MKIVGSVIVGQHIQPFYLDLEIGSLSTAVWIRERGIKLNEEEKAGYKAEIFRKMSPLIIDDVKIGEYYCQSCHKWYSANDSEWSFSICLSCSLDLGSEITEKNDQKN